MYERPFYIEEKVSNNIFGYDRRERRRLFVPSLIVGDLSDVRPGKEIVFEDFNDDANLKGLRSCKGLRHFVKMTWRGVPAYIFDNHNHAFAFWHLEAIRGSVAFGATLIHMDRHKDSRKPVKFLSRVEALDPDAVFKYANSTLNVGNFIPAAVHTGLINEVINLDGESSLKNFDTSLLERAKRAGRAVIFDLDLDFFAPEMDYVDHRLKVETIGKIVRGSALITIATSPFFIDQNLALERLRGIAAILR